MISRIIKKIFKSSDHKEFTKSIALTGKACLLAKQNKYDEYKGINQAEFKIFSQNGEDGIIDYLLYKLRIQDPSYVEIGVENYDESNTRFLYETTNSQGLIIDSDIDVNKLNQKFETWKGRLSISKELVSAENVSDILKNKNYNKELDLFSIDIDGIDYWVIKSLRDKISKIFIAEYNPLFGPEIEVSVPNIKNFNRTEYHYSNLCWGMSLKSLINLMVRKGYIFLGTNALKNNAFFVQKFYQNNFEQVYKNINLDDLGKYTDHKFCESRDKKSNLTFLNPKQQIELIKECKVVDLSSKDEKLVTIKELI